MTEAVAAGALDNPELPAAHGPFSRAFAMRVRAALRMSPSLVRHVAEQMTVTSAPAGDEGGGGVGKKAPPLPFNVAAHDASHGIVALHGGWAELFGLTAPEPAWRHASGAILGYDGGVDPAGMHEYVGEAVDAIRADLDGILERVEPELLLAWERDLTRRVIHVAANFPREDDARFLQAPHRECMGQIVYFPPEWQKDEPFIVCTGCGATFDEATVAENERLAVEVAKAERKKRMTAVQVQKRLARKHARQAEKEAADV